jgi:outer membrane immunogenic protein
LANGWLEDKVKLNLSSVTAQRDLVIMAKRIGLGIAALAILSCVGARADDYYAPPPVSPFGGLEVGGQIGAAVGGTGNVSPSGFGGGAYAGYNLQNGPIVGGLEGDALLASINGDGGGGSLSQNWLTSLRVRGGWAFGNVLAYGTIGPAFATSSFQESGFTFDKELHGYTFGFGGEVAITRQISARAEFRHYDFGAATYYMPGGAQKLSTGNNLLMVGAGVRF